MTLVPKKLTQCLVIIVASLLLGHVAAKTVTFLGYDISNLTRLVDVDEENNLPSWYSSSALLLASFLLLIIGFSKKRDGDRYAFHWLALSAIFLYLSIDEAASIHEMAIYPIRSAIPRYTSGYLYYAWVIPGSLFGLSVLLMNLRFLAHLPISTRRLFLLGGAVYVVGALGIEMLSAKFDTVYGYQGLTFSLIVAAEEGCEMFGIVIFIHALSSYIASHLKDAFCIANWDVEHYAAPRRIRT
ncbi:MAG TPA: hypothetical protein VJ692_15465 [Nitrospiraceae bacterium]|nr:hypothetical protein [Nitrospiraceae bacterium]